MVVYKLRRKYEITVLCNYLQCSRSGYYDWVHRDMPRHNKIDHERADAIKVIFSQKKTRGRRQVQMQLERQYGIHMSLGSVHRYMSILNIKSIRKKKYVPQKKQEQKLAHSFPNVLQQDFCPSSTTEKWLTDITYIPSKNGTLYLSCIKDVRDKSIIAYHYSEKNNNELVLETLRKSIPSIPDKELILHSDQGSQYVSVDYHEFLRERKITGSMSRKGTPYDNSPMESFFSVLKNEELKLHRGKSMNEIKIILDQYIHYYNYERPQYGLKKLTPIEYRSQF